LSDHIIYIFLLILHILRDHPKFCAICAIESPKTSHLLIFIGIDAALKWKFKRSKAK